MIKNYNLIKDMYSGMPWLISNTHAYSYIELLRNITAENSSKPEISSVYNRKNVSNKEGKVIGNVAVISIVGAMTKYDPFCAYGMESYIGLINRANEDPNIDAIIIKEDCPGSSVAGIDEMALTIENCTKPVVAFVDDLAASGGYWVASSCDYIIANNEHAQIGSIGVMTSIPDFRGMYEKEGIKLHEFNSSKSKDKNADYKEILDGKYDNYIKSVLDPLADKFHAHVRSNRPDVADEHLTGKVFFAKDVVGTLIDEIGPFEQAMKKALELADDNANINSQNTVSMKQFENVNKALGLDSLENVDGHVSLNEEQLQALDSYIANGNKAKETAESALSTAKKAQKTAEENAESAQNELATATSALDEISEVVAEAEGLDNKVKAIRTELASRPSSGGQGASQEGENLDGDGADWNAIDSMPHNKAADQIL